jgi:hypothetical protein
MNEYYITYFFKKKEIASCIIELKDNISII